MVRTNEVVSKIKLSPMDCDETKSVSEKYAVTPSSVGKWKRERKFRSGILPIQALSPDYHASKCFAAELRNRELDLSSEPLDMSTRCAPSSYLQSRPTVIYPSAKAPPRLPSPLELPDSSSSPDVEDACENEIEEHFRRSLGKDYQNVFLSSGNTSPTAIKSVSPLRVSQTVVDSPLSVDEHFAKALGSTWIKLQQQKEERRPK